MHSNVCDVGYSSCAEKCRRHTHWYRAGAEDALIGLVQNLTRVSYLTCVKEAIRHNFIRLCPSINSYDDSFSMVSLLRMQGE